MLDLFPLDAIDQLTPEECADFLQLQSRDEFVLFMRRTLTPEESARLSDKHLHALYDGLQQRLKERAQWGALHRLLNRSVFVQRWLAAVDVISPQDSACILARTTPSNLENEIRKLFPVETQTLTDHDIQALHDETCRRLRAKARELAGSLELSAPPGEA